MMKVGLLFGFDCLQKFAGVNLEANNFNLSSPESKQKGSNQNGIGPPNFPESKTRSEHEQWGNPTLSEEYQVQQHDDAFGCEPPRHTSGI